MAESITGTVKALGLMSGTSLDGIDAAIIVTDGERVVDFGPALAMPYDPVFRDRLKSALAGTEDSSLERDLTTANAEAVKKLLGDHHIPASEIRVIGYHGQTVLHDPANGVTRQLGDGALLANEAGIPVVNDFRSADVAAGGEGAPFAPLYHAALATNLEKPLCVLNLGGVANVTYLGAGGGDPLAFDCGPGNALIDDWTAATIGRAMDEGGRLARGGSVDAALLDDWLEHAYFSRPAPKSLDRDDFTFASDQLAAAGLTPADGAATLTRFTALAAARALDQLPEPPKRWIVTGGGRHNRALMDALAEGLGQRLEPAEAVGWRGDSLEAEAFAYLAVRSLKGLALSLPTTTGVPAPTCGGVLHNPE